MARDFVSLSAAEIKRDSSIKLKGFFDMEGNLKFIKKWMEDRGYSFYERRFNQKPDIQGDRYKIKIESDKRTQAFVKWYLIVDVLGNDIIQKEVIENGKKVMKTYGRIKYNFDCKLVLDPDGLWDGTPGLHKLYNLMLGHPSRFVHWEMEMIWWDELYYDMYALKEAFSRHLNLYYIG